MGWEIQINIMEQTAVDFVIEAYEKFINSENGSGEPYYLEELKKDVEIGKQMMEEQIMEAYDKGSDVDDDLQPLHGTPEQYYNETYKNK